MGVVELVDVQAARFAAAVRARLAEPRRDRNGDAVLAADGDLEIAALRDRSLMDVPRDDQLGARVHKRREHVVAPRDRALARAPRRADEMVVQDGDAQRVPVAGVQRCGRAFELRLPDSAGLVPPRANRVEADGDDAWAAVDGLGRLPVTLE